ncbi:MAG: class I SAM-dependent methyltransferase [Crocinitomicaceae bacterium]|jgi:predicted TPR repeat methyltransferase|nr:class I SAM-dependent methyltransferase [Crocinitomicaceae bacterium]
MDDKSRSAQVVFGSHAAEYADKYWHLPQFSNLIARLTKALPFQAKVLDLGCGPGNMSHLLLDKRDDLRIEGWDFAPEMIGLAAQKVPKATFQVKNVLELDKDLGKWDAVVLAFCAPYLSTDDLKKVLRNIQSNLVHDGLLYFSTMISAEKQEFWMPPRVEGDQPLFVYIHQRAEILTFMEALGMLLVQEQRIQLEGGAGDEDWVGIFQKKKA